MSTAKTARFFCMPAPTELGDHSLSVVSAMVHAGISVRLLALYRADWTDSTNTNTWAEYRNLFVTPMTGEYVNLVSGGPSDWDRLHTTGVKNVIVTNKEAPEKLPPRAFVDAEKPLVDPYYVAKRFELAIVPSEEISLSWKAMDIATVVVQKGWSTHDATVLRDALL